MKQHIFRAYDIRGRVEPDLTPELRLACPDAIKLAMARRELAS